MQLLPLGEEGGGGLRERRTAMAFGGPAELSPNWTTKFHVRERPSSAESWAEAAVGTLVLTEKDPHHIW